MAAEITKILTAEQEAQLLQPIDEYVGAIQEKINALRLNGTDKVLDIQNSLENLKRDRIYTCLLYTSFALGSAMFAGLTAILAKIGIENVNSTLATALRTVVVLVFSWVMVFIVGSQSGIGDISGRTLLFLVLSGLATGASWLCYFRTLQLGDVNKDVYKRQMQTAC